MPPDSSYSAIRTAHAAWWGAADTSRGPRLLESVVETGDPYEYLGHSDNGRRGSGDTCTARGGRVALHPKTPIRPADPALRSGVRAGRRRDGQPVEGGGGTQNP